MRLRILRRHIENAGHAATNNKLEKTCPVALALQEKGYKDAWVSCWNWGDGNNSYDSKTKLGSLEPDAYQFVYDYDMMKTVFPTTITLNRNI